MSYRNIKMSLLEGIFIRVRGGCCEMRSSLTVRKYEGSQNELMEEYGEAA